MTLRRGNFRAHRFASCFNNTTGGATAILTSANIGLTIKQYKPNPVERFTMIKHLRAVVAIVSLLLATGMASVAQEFPIKTVRIVVPYAAGGITDIVARLLAQQLGERWGQQVIVDNKPGANAQIGAELVLRAPPDGYTLLVSADTTFVMNPHLHRDAKYDPLTEFAPISGLGSSPQALVVNPETPLKTVADLIEFGKAHPGQLNYGTFGLGSSGHLNIEMLRMMTGARFTPVHYRGAAPAISDLLGGHIQFMIVSVGLVADMVQTGKLRALAIGSDKRLAQFPDTPTLAENGLNGFERGSWYGLVAPKGTPPDVIKKISEDTEAVFNDPAFQKKSLAPSFIYSIASDPSAFADMMRRESAKWKRVIEAAGVRID
jgi:tripartite-type tricarboxylate transporter receptor subunit TctC